MNNYYADHSEPPTHRQPNDAMKVVLIVVASVAVVFLLMCAGIFAIGFVGFQATRQEITARQDELRARRAVTGSAYEAQQYQFFVNSGDYSAALQQMNAALDANPEDANSHNNKAWLLCTCPVEELRDGMLAIVHAKQACDLTDYKNEMFLDTLAAAYAETGDFDEAVRWQQETIAMQQPGDYSFQEYQDRLKLYQSGQPYREGVVPPGSEYPDSSSATSQASSTEPKEAEPTGETPIDVDSIGTNPSLPDESSTDPPTGTESEPVPADD